MSRLRKCCVEDCERFPLSKGPRVVILKSIVVPKLEQSMSPQDAFCEHVNLQFVVSAGVPKLTSSNFVAAVRPGHELAFSPDFPEDPDQVGLFDDSNMTQEQA